MRAVVMVFGEGLWRRVKFSKGGGAMVMLVRTGVMMVFGSEDSVLGNVGEMGDGGGGLDRFQLAENDQNCSQQSVMMMKSA